MYMKCFLKCLTQYKGLNVAKIRAGNIAQIIKIFKPLEKVPKRFYLVLLSWLKFLPLYILESRSALLKTQTKMYSFCINLCLFCTQTLWGLTIKPVRISIFHSTPFYWQVRVYWFSHVKGKDNSDLSHICISDWSASVLKKVVDL